ncbi:uncharacterized protein Dvir_GJ20982 [Drosophila virilis]|uniref:Gustatory receptor n=1 Tax=Drosophila virilis TaxID=7244 RepID=B4LPC2_DROVI|nr:uncharacterized protein Dvir_GJ20982 [Drosophila virilis]
MFDPIKWILRMVYFYSRLLGVINFEIDMKTGRASVTRRASIYAGVVNGLILSLLPFLSLSNLLQTMWSHAGLLHEYLFLVIYVTRVSCLVITLCSRWWQRGRLIHLVNAFSRLAFRRPQVMRMWRRRVVLKFMSIFLSEISQVAISFYPMRSYLTLKLTFSILMLYAMTALVNVIISHFYFINGNVHSHYILLNQEIQAVLSELRSLETEHRRATRMIKCCFLADQLEDIARTQSELQTLLKRSARIFDIQGLCITVIMYLSMIATIYFTFVGLTSTNRTLNWSFSNILFLFEVAFYFADILVTMDNLYIVLDVHAEMVTLLAQFSTLAPGLDERLEMVYESFQLQLARNPLQVCLFYLYKVERAKAVAIASSIVSNSLVLVQYEVQNT